MANTPTGALFTAALNEAFDSETPVIVVVAMPVIEPA
jgi:hypothetical protein